MSEDPRRLAGWAPAATELLPSVSETSASSSKMAAAMAAVTDSVELGESVRANAARDAEAESSESESRNLAAAADADGDTSDAVGDKGGLEDR
jgi:hypothetical protein